MLGPLGLFSKVASQVLSRPSCRPFLRPGRTKLGVGTTATVYCIRGILDALLVKSRESGLELSARVMAGGVIGSCIGFFYHHFSGCVFLFTYI